MSRSNYLALVAILSEMMSVVQSILALSGFSFHYFSLVFFGACALPALMRVSAQTCLVLSSVVILQLVKSLLIGVGPEFSKACILISFAIMLSLLGRQMKVEDFVKTLQKLRWYILFLGLIYILGWTFWGTYRNASTFSLAIMLFLGFKGTMRFSSLIFIMNAKTLFQILSFTFIVSWFAKSLALRTIFITSCVLFAALAPVLLAKFISPNLVIFSASHTASLAERLLETSTLLNNLKNNGLALMFGDQIGWVLLSDDIEPRGYVHANHLWLIRTFGIPIWLFGVVILVRYTRFGDWKIMGLRAVILVSQAFLMTMFTSPFLTMFLFCRTQNER